MAELSEFLRSAHLLMTMEGASVRPSLHRVDGSDLFSESLVERLLEWPRFTESVGGLTKELLGAGVSRVSSKTE